MRAPLFLSRRNADNSVLVPSEVTEKLSDYDIDSVRHMYKYYVKRTNVFLNTEEGMNEPLQIYAFLTAVNSFPTLITCPNSEVSKWQSVLEENKEFNLVMLENATSEIRERKNLIVVAPHSILRRALHLRDIPWQILIIQNIDVIIDLVSIKKLREKSKFSIAITRYNFVLNPNKQLYNKIINWSTDEKIPEISELYIPNQWLRLSWHQYNPKDQKMIY